VGRRPHYAIMLDHRGLREYHDSVSTRCPWAYVRAEGYKGRCIEPLHCAQYMKTRMLTTHPQCYCVDSFRVAPCPLDDVLKILLQIFHSIAGRTYNGTEPLLIAVSVTSQCPSQIKGQIAHHKTEPPAPRIRNPAR
jgi:hypothetical protein